MTAKTSAAGVRLVTMVERARSRVHHTVGELYRTTDNLTNPVTRRLENVTMGVTVMIKLCIMRVITARFALTLIAITHLNVAPSSARAASEVTMATSVGEAVRSIVIPLKTVVDPIVMKLTRCVADMMALAHLDASMASTIALEVRVIICLYLSYCSVYVRENLS